MLDIKRIKDDPEAVKAGLSFFMQNVHTRGNMHGNLPLFG